MMLTCAAETASAQAGDTSAIARALADFTATCGTPAAAVWGRGVCGPVLLVDRGTRATFANAPDPDGLMQRHGDLWVGQASADIPFANTSFAWKGRRWAVVMLPLPEARWNALVLLTHEATHRLQDEQHWPRRDALNAHLDSEAGRLWWRLELRALQHALTTTGTARRAHARAAMHFRRYRQQLMPVGAANEDSLEYAEGSAEYLGQRVAHSVSNLGILLTVNQSRAIEASATLVRSAAYATGPALGLLLDDIAPGWPARLHQRRSMAGLLIAALRMPAAVPSADSLARLAEPYGYARIAREEAARARLTALLVDGPTITLRHTGANRTFDPNSLIPFDTLGTVYPTGTFDAEWGRLEVRAGGALLSSDGLQIRIAAIAADGVEIVAGARETIRGAQWTLVLKPGWQLRAGPRAGSFEVMRTP